MDIREVLLFISGRSSIVESSSTCNHIACEFVPIEKFHSYIFNLNHIVDVHNYSEFV